MIQLDVLNKAYELARETSILASDSEVSLYNVGAFSKGNIVRIKLNYLEVYTSCIKDIIEFTNLDIGNYTDLGFTDSQIQQCIEDIYEICSEVFDVKTLAEQPYFYIYPVSLVVSEINGFDSEAFNISANKSWTIS